MNDRTDPPDPNDARADEAVETLRRLSSETESLVDAVQRSLIALKALAAGEARLSLLGIERVMWMLPLLAMIGFGTLMTATAMLAYAVWQITGSGWAALSVVVLAQLVIGALLLHALSSTWKNMAFPRTRAQLRRWADHGLE